MKDSVKIAYEDLYRYFGLRNKDSYLSAAVASNSTSTSSTTAGAEKSLGDVYHMLYGDENENPTIDKICNGIEGMGLGVAKDIVCITPYNKNELGVTDVNKIPLNDKNVTGFSEQGVRSTGASNDLFTIKDLNPNKFSDNMNRIDVLQVFPSRTVSELADTDILTLYLSTINSVNMSMAVPYVNVLVSVQGQENADISSQAFSFGNFLGDPKDGPMNAKFKNQSLSGAGTISSTDASGKEVRRKIQAVASMEIFTSPQTLVNATPENVRYDENSQVGRHVDIFRPFLSIESLSLTVVPASAGLIAFKTGNMKLKLFDRGRLSQIAPIVAPSRFGVVKFDIEYGWSHPAGRTTVGRPGDAQDDRIGQLIDAMRVTESYQVVNSNFTFEQDGSVSIDIKLSMLASRSIQNRSVKFAGDDADVKDIEALLKEIQRILTGFSKDINIPSILTGGVDTFINMDEGQQKDLMSFVQGLIKGKNKLGALAQGVSSRVSKLIGSNPKKLGGEAARFQKTRSEKAQRFINDLRKQGDPFLRFEGLSGKGVTKEEIMSGDFSSLGSIIINTIGPALQEAGDVIFIFSCFNKNAAAMYDHNIAQFPIRIDAKDDKKLTLRTILQREMKKSTNISPEGFFRMLNDNFILRESTEAYGLSEVFLETPVFDKEGEIKESYVKGVEVDSEKPETQLIFEEKRLSNLEKIYGSGRQHPNFTLPRLTMKIDVKPAADGSNVIRVIIFDQAASNVADMQEVFNDVTSMGFFEKDTFPDPVAGVRSARHGEIANKMFNDMNTSGLIEKYVPDKSKGEKPTLLEQLEETAKKDSGSSDPVYFEPLGSASRQRLIEKMDRIYFMKDFGASSTKLRDIFYKYFPTIVYGSMGSGIISAQLSSNQNDALTTIALQKQEGDTSVPVGLPILIHPTQLSLEVFGTPMFKFSQKFFVDFGTGTSADNFYVVTGVDMNFDPGNFKCNLKMTQLDVFGRFMKLKDSIFKTLIASYRKEKLNPP